MQFQLSDNEQAKAEAWMKECYAENSSHAGAIGGRFTYSFTPTSLGDVIKIKDAITDREIDVTDYGLW